MDICFIHLWVFKILLYGLLHLFIIFLSTAEKDAA